MGEKRKSEQKVRLEVQAKTPRLSVALASFPGVMPAPDTQFKVFQNRDPLKAHQQVVVGSSDKVEFHAATYGSQRASPLFSKYLIGVYDPATRTVKLQEAPVLTFARQVKALKNVPACLQDLMPDDVSNAAASAGQMMDSRLGMAFGTRRTKVMLSNVEKNRLNFDTLTTNEGAVQSAIQTVDVHVANLDTVHDDGSTELLPRCNSTTEDVSQIYKLSAIIGSADLKSISVQRFLDEVLNPPKPEKGVEVAPEEKFHGEPLFLSKFVKSKVQAIIANGQENSESMAALIYLNSLIHFARKGRMFFARNPGQDPQHVLPARIVTRMHNQFSGQAITEDGFRRRVISDVDTHRLRCYILIMVLLFNNYIVDIDAIAPELQLDSPTCVKYCRMIGCVVKGSNRDPTVSQSTATLSAPLKVDNIIRKGGPPGRR
ncbi:DNA-directed RNA polymerase I subunit rpa49 [Dimargaris cristalligena]|nr:DNA-directed RNA polymerase I subunit rpa49 [Dimargaris cristalligena]